MVRRTQLPVFWRTEKGRVTHPVAGGMGVGFGPMDWFLNLDGSIGHLLCWTQWEACHAPTAASDTSRKERQACVGMP